MNTEPTAPQFERSPEFFIAEVAHRWLSGIDRSSGQSDITVDRGQKIDPEKGILYDIMVIKVARQMEKVTQNTEAVVTETP